MKKKRFIILLYILFAVHLGVCEIILETDIDMSRSDEYILHAVFTHKKSLTAESFHIKDVPVSADYNIVKQSYSEKIIREDSEEIIRRTYSFYIKPLKDGKINIQSIEFVNSSNDKKFLTVPKTIDVKNFAKFKRYGKVLLLVTVFFLVCFFVFIWIGRKKDVENPVQTIQTEESEISSIDDIIKRIEGFLETGHHKEVFAELNIASELCGNQEYKAKIRLIINDNASQVKYGGEKLNSQIKDQILGILQQMSREENLEQKAKCPSCGHIVSDQDLECSNCGEEFEVI